MERSPIWVAPGGDDGGQDEDDFAWDENLLDDDDDDDVVANVDPVAGATVPTRDILNWLDRTDEDDEADIEDDELALERNLEVALEQDDDFELAEDMELAPAEHAPELQAALAAATQDIEAVEDRLSTLFERKVPEPPPGPPRYPIHVEEPVVSSEPTLYDEFGSVLPHSEFLRGGDWDPADEDGTFAALDAALATETPEEPDRRGLFRRRA